MLEDDVLRAVILRVTLSGYIMTNYRLSMEISNSITRFFY